MTVFGCLLCKNDARLPTVCLRRWCAARNQGIYLTITRDMRMFQLRDFSTVARHCVMAPFQRRYVMTKAELVDQVVATVQLPKHQTDAVITRFLQAIMEALRAGESVELRGFGRFRLRHL